MTTWSSVITVYLLNMLLVCFSLFPAGNEIGGSKVYVYIKVLPNYSAESLYQFSALSIWWKFPLLCMLYNC